MTRWRIVVAGSASLLALVAACGSFGADTVAARDAGADETSTTPGADGGTSDASAPPPPSCQGLEADTGCSVLCTATTLCESCKQVHELFSTLPTGPYVLRGQEGNLDVWCDMETRGGGWAMAARSTDEAPVSADEFGWLTDGGDLFDLRKPYSLGVDNLTELPHEILFGARGQGRGWSNNVYYARLPADFFTVAKDKAVELQEVASVIGDCPKFAFQKWAGFTGIGDHFHFRDVYGEAGRWGLSSQKWDVNGSLDCAMGGNLQDTTGMIFVR